MMYKKFSFSSTNSKENKQRIGFISTPNGLIETPAFVTCATKGCVKSLESSIAANVGCQALFVNAYHIFANGSSEIIKSFGGIHNFMNWSRPVFTDSGGFQIFSLGFTKEEIFKNSIKECEIKGVRKRKSKINISENGVEFQSHIDGSKKLITPEISMRIQNSIGSDIALVFDECTTAFADRAYTEKSTFLSSRWALRSLEEFHKINTSLSQSLYGIIQGGVYKDLRQISANLINKNDFFGIAIGGSLGKTKEQMYEIVNYTCSIIDRKKPIHLLGVGGIKDIVQILKENCIDTFDCVHPTRIARHGCAIVPNSEFGKDRINLYNAAFKEDKLPIYEKCLCTTCQKLSRSYIHYLLKNKEITAHQLLTTHNLFQMNELMSDIRNAIKDNKYYKVEEKWLSKEYS